MLRKIQILIITLLLMVLVPANLVFAQYTSPHYQSNEVFFGAGGDLENSSPNYKAKTSVGELGVGNTASTNYQAYAGFNTTDRPLLEVAVTGGTFDFGTLSPSQTAVITTVFTVRNYLSSGYVVTVGGSPPHNGNYYLAALTSPTASSHGTEQFGINLVANNVPSPNGIGAFGANPQQVPNASPPFGFGTATNGYATANSFKFNQPANDITDTVAQSLQSSGITQYTMSAIANINATTPGGAYGTSLFVNVTPTF